MQKLEIPKTTTKMEITHDKTNIHYTDIHDMRNVDSTSAKMMRVKYVGGRGPQRSG